MQLTLFFAKEARGKRKQIWEQHTSRTKQVIYAIVVLYFWNIPLATMSKWGLWPLGWLFSFPGHPTSSIGVVATVTVTQQGMSRLLSFIL
jgi:hypothetical protein